jgi:hypothetical protein
MVTRSPHKRLLIAAALVLGLVAFAPGTASAQSLLDPATLHINGGTAFLFGNEVHGVDSGLVSVTQNSGGAGDLTVPWLLILAIPNVTSTNAQITSVNGVSTTIDTNGTSAIMTDSDVYSVLPNTPGANNSNSFVNYQAADLAVNGITANSFLLVEFNVPVTVPGDGSPVTLQLSNVPIGTFVVAYGDDGKLLYSTPFTESGVTTGNTPQAVPEPSTMALAGLGALGLIGYGLRRKSPTA